MLRSSFGDSNLTLVMHHAGESSRPKDQRKPEVSPEH